VIERFLPSAVRARAGILTGRLAAGTGASAAINLATALATARPPTTSWANDTVILDVGILAWPTTS